MNNFISPIQNAQRVGIIVSIVVFSYRKNLTIAPVLLVAAIVNIIALLFRYVMIFSRNFDMDIKDISLTYGIIGVISMISTILFLGSLLSYFMKIEPEAPGDDQLL